jgi:LmbE family N-acetylglucosaminyl deacetylase
MALKFTLSGFFICLSLLTVKTQSSHIYHDIQKLKTIGTALYIAAHPDDENTRMISHLNNDRKVRTIYLSLTRGDGGQNLIGPELGSKLGLIRTQELLAARKIDGGEQFFSRANDFGYSKTPEETLEIWEDDEVLADVVWAIRKFKPDVIINRFNHERTRRTHGHHTASAMLSYEAFDLAGDPTKFPEQLALVEPWSPSRLYFNTSWWFYGSREKFEEADKSRMAMVDVGAYYPAMGTSNNEISSRSRSMHKCQGFGSELSRGTQNEYLQLLKGDLPANKDDIFDAIDLDWTRLEGGQPVNQKIEAILENFRVDDPSLIVSELLELKKLMNEVQDDHWRNIKMKDLDNIIMDCMGLFVSATTRQEVLVAGSTFDWEFEAINRSKMHVTIDSVVAYGISLDTLLAIELKPNEGNELKLSSQIQTSIPTNPYWLNEMASLGMYHVEDRKMIGQPENHPSHFLKVFLNVEGQTIDYLAPLISKRVDPVKGEIINSLPISSGLSLKIDQELTLFKPSERKKISVTVSGKANIHKGTLRISSPEGWSVSPDSITFNIHEDEIKRFDFWLHSPTQGGEGFIKASCQVGDQHFSKSETIIAYDHIPYQQVIEPAQARVLCTEIIFPGGRVGYIVGAGDQVPASLEQVGYRVDILDPENLSAVQLQSYDAIIVGIRAFNTVPSLKNSNKVLFDYAYNGGTVVVQYNTRHRLVTEQLAPYDLKLSRDRVTLESSEVSILLPEHRVLNEPNKISLDDFDNWVQERGLYFPGEWSDNFEAPISMNDPGEAPLAGSLLIAKHGQGHYVYTSISWFRELPAGVEGAYRIFANILSLGHNVRP